MKGALIFQSDFGIADGAVSAMYGVAYSVSPSIHLFDLTHEIPQYNIWEASYRLIQTVTYWPAKSVFVSVVDPGVGSSRKSVVAKLNSGQFIVTPDNGTLTHIKRTGNVVEVREIDESVNRLPNSGASYTSHGRDVYAYTGARLAAGIITFEEVGPIIPTEEIVELPIIESTKDNDVVSGTIDVLDVRYGSLWTNIGRELFLSTGIKYGDRVEVSIKNDTREVYRNIIVFGTSFAEVNVGETLLYVNSLDNLAVAINQGSFSKAYNIQTGTNWRISIRKAPRIIYE